MVFENLVADLLNRFLGDYIDNLDASQLNIGIWGGDVKLNNLEVKQTALDDLDLPVKLKFGYLSSLVLKIPWKNLYTEPVIAKIEGLHLIVVPNKGVVYHDEKAHKNEQEVKQKALARLEENRKNKRKPKDPAADTFTEKLVAQVIKNLQVRIENIHVRYEDRYSNRHRPFAAGITLELLNFETTDADWKATVHKEAVKIFYKLISLNSLAVYWNSKSEMISDLKSNKEILEKMQHIIATQKHRPEGYKYILDPIAAEAKLALNQKPEADGSNWSIPKIDLKAGMETLALRINRYQYQDLLLFLDAQERFNLATRYLKYRPNLVDYRGHYRDWWHFAYKCILEETIRRKRKNWSWERMKRHRKLVKDYRDAWIKKQTEKNLSSDTTALIREAEEKLDVFNLNIARQQAELEIDRRGLGRLEDQPQTWGGWAKSWFTGGGGAKAPKKPPAAGATGGDIAASFEQAMTPEEKAKLFEAIDYQENTPPTDYPKHYVENKIAFDLSKLAIVVDETLHLQLGGLSAKVEQRPSARAIHIKSAVKSLSMEGDKQPMLSMMDAKRDWLSMEVITNPLEGGFDQFVGLGIAPVLLKYHAPAINTAIAAFRPPESIRLTQLTAAAIARYEDVKARSITGLQHAVDEKSKLKLDIRIEPATIIITEGGIFNESRPNLVAELGLLTIQTTDVVSPEAYKNVADEKLRTLMAKAYDKFQVRLSNMQLLFADSFKSCMAARGDNSSRCHIIRPTGLDVELHKSAIDDLNIPKIRLFGDLPDIVVNISDQRLLQLVQLGLSIPLPPPPEGAQEVDLGARLETTNLRDRAKMKAIMEVDEVEMDEAALERQTRVAEETDSTPSSTTTTTKESEKKLNEQQVQIDVSLRLNQIGINVSKGEDLVLSANLRRFGMNVQMRTFDLVVSAHMGSLTVEMPKFKSLTAERDQLFLIDNAHAEGDHLIQMKYVQANPESPFFTTEYHSTEQAIDFDFKSLNLTLHQEALMDMKAFSEKLQKQLETERQKKPAKWEDVAETGRKLSRQISIISTHSNASGVSGTTGTIRKARKQREREHATEADELVKMRLNANFNSLSLLIGTARGGPDTKVEIQQITSSVIMKTKFTKVVAGLRTVGMVDMTPRAVHRNLVAVCGNQEMLHLDFVQYNRTDEEKRRMPASSHDMSVKLRFAQLRFVFLNLWVNRMLQWISPFQAEAAAAAAQAQAIAAERAAQAAQNVKQILEVSPPKIALDIELAAPAIVVPRLSTSEHVLLVNLGHLHINNSFSTVSQSTMDNMEIQLKDVSIATGLLEKTKDLCEGLVSSRCNILRPLTFKLLLIRNLSFQAHKDIPEISISAHLPLIDLTLSQEDYAVMMHTLSGNLAEGVPPKPVTATAVAAVEPEAPKDTQPPKSPTTDKPDAAQEAREDVTQRTEKPPPSSKDHRRLLFKFEMDEVSATLYRGETGLQKGRDLVTRNDEQRFAAMNLQKLVVSGSMTENGCLLFALSLDVFTMNDERKESTKIKRLLDKKKTDASPLFVQLHFSQDERGNKEVRLVSSSFFLLLSPEFLGSLASFFVVPNPPEKQDEPVGVRARRQAISGKVAQTAATPSAPVAPAGTLTLNCRVHDIEVILIENSLKPETSQALILSFNCQLDAKNNEGVQSVEGGIMGLQIVSTYYAENKRYLSNYPVLRKVDVQLSGMINERTKSQNFAIILDTVHLKMSPSIIRLLSAVASEFSAHHVKDASQSHKVPTLKDYPGYWQPKHIDRDEHWWFQEVAEEAVEDYQPQLDIIQSADRDETATFTIGNLVMTVEAGRGNVTVPMILLESSVDAKVEEWTGVMRADASLQLQMCYYNETFSVWEPVIEPVLSKESGAWESWKLTAEVRTHSEEEATVSSDGTPAPAPPKMTVKISASEVMNITVTKSFLRLLNQLSDGFEKAAKQIEPPKSRPLPGNSPYLILNDTGVAVKVVNSDTLKVSETNEAIDTTHGEFVELDMINWKQEIGLQSAEVQRKAELRLEFLNVQREVDVMRAELRSVPVPKHADSGKQWTMLVQTEIENSRRVINLKSLVNFVNHMDISLDVYSLRDTNLDLCGTVEPGAILNVPLPVLYTATGELFFRPSNDQYETSSESVVWHEFDKTKRWTVRCDLSSNLKEGLYIDVAVVDHEIIGERNQKLEQRAYTAHIYPALKMRNLLPFPITITSPVQQTLNGGDDVVLNVIARHKIEYWFEYGEQYSVTMDVPVENDLRVVTCKSEDGSKEVNLGALWSVEHRQREFSLYAPYWVVNKTGKTLSYMENPNGHQILKSPASCCPHRRASHGKDDYTMRHEPDRNPVIMPFASHEKGGMSERKAKLRIENSGWSDAFPLDVAGSAGRITCTGEDGRELEVTVDVQLCQSGLTKVVTFTPFYLFQNDTKFAVEFNECGEKKWERVPPESCVPVWPSQKCKRKTIEVRYEGQNQSCRPFPITENFEGFCQIENDYIGFYVASSVGESSAVVHVEPFHPGMAPAIIMNATEYPIEYHQKGFPNSTILKPWDMCAFTWDDAAAQDRKLVWKSGDHSAEEALIQNHYSSYLPSTQNQYHYWVSFLNGRQRVFLLTNDLAVMTTAYEAYEVERINIQTEISIRGIGISLVNNFQSKEVIYMAISSSGVVWEQRHRNRFRPMAVKMVEACEEAYQEWANNGKPNQSVHVHDVDLDFTNMILRKKGGKRTEWKIRRSFLEGFWLQHSQSDHQTRLHLKINHIQIDNQLPACIFPCVLTVVPPPRSVVADQAPKPFTELSFIMSQSEHSNVVVIKYLHVLVQELAVRIDHGLINSALDLFSAETAIVPYTREVFEKDMELTRTELNQKAIIAAATQQKAFYEDMHISPLMIHLSFSLGGSSDEHKKGAIQIQSELINVVLKSVGVTLTELQDVVFKLAYFERKCNFYNRQQLQAEVQGHYTAQLIKQFYVLVLGLDIIGNPFGLVRDLATGVEDLFYQPFQGAIQGPEEFMEGLSLGVQSLFGHAVGGAAGAVSRIAGTVGKGVAALTLDAEYQRKRQEALNRRPQNFGEGMARGVKGLGQGLFDGITGVVTKPVEGAREGGVGGFAKGVGKGIVGVVTRPVSGVVDFASGTIDAVKTAAGLNEETKPLRPPRLILADQIVRPYSYKDALGVKIFRDTDRGKWADTDNFVAYGNISERFVFLVTDKRVVLAKRQDVIGVWTADWSMHYGEINPPKRTERGVIIEPREKKKGFLGIGGSKAKCIQFTNEEVANTVAERLIHAYNQYA